MHYAFINSTLVPYDQATIPISDRGFRFGDGIFETIAVHNGKMYQWAEHLARFNSGLEALKIQYDTSELATHCMALIEANKVSHGMLRLALSRGSGSQGYLPLPDITPHLVIETLPPPNPIEEPVSLWLSSYIKPDTSHYPVGCKTMQGLNSILARLEAQENNCFEALLCNHEGYMCEASSSNLFWVKDGTVYTAARESGLLAGVMRQLIITLSPYPVKEGLYTIENLLEAQEVFLSNSAWNIISVAQLQPQAQEWHDFSVSLTLKQLINEHIEQSTQ